MTYDIIQTDQFIRHKEKILGNDIVSYFDTFWDKFQKDPFDKAIGTHIITAKSIPQCMYVSYVTHKIKGVKEVRLVFFFQKDKKTILLYKIMLDHDYNKLLKNTAAIRMFIKRAAQ